MIIIERVNSHFDVLDQSRSATGLGANEIIAAAVDQVSDSVAALNKSRRLIWGGRDSQILQRQYIDCCLTACTTATPMKMGSSRRFDPSVYQINLNAVRQNGAALYFRIRNEVDLLSSEIASLEPVVLQRF